MTNDRMTNVETEATVEPAGRSVSAPSTATASWGEELLKNPHIVADKRRRVQEMFAAIAPSYDLNNRLHSLWMDQRWRRKAVKLAMLKPTDVVVDVACGTGDLIEAFRDVGDFLPSGSDESSLSLQYLGIDFTFAMLPIARRKGRFKDLISGIQYINGDAQSLPLPDKCADVVSIAFGIRNVVQPLAALREFHRILRPGGRVIILEFSLPENAVLRGLYNFYFRRILPRSATLISGDKTGAYRYLPESVNTFIGRAEMMKMMKEADFTEIEQHPMTFGVCVCYRGLVRSSS